MDKYRKVYLVDEDRTARMRISESLISSDFEVRPLDGRDFADLAPTLPPGCAVVEIFHKSVPNFAPLEIAVTRLDALPTIAMCEDCNIKIAVAAIKLGAVDVYEKRTPVTQLINIVEKVICDLPNTLDHRTSQATKVKAILSLTRRQFQIIVLVAQGNLTKTVAHKLKISPRTVEMHRDGIVQRLTCKRMVDAVIMLQSVSCEKEIVDRCELDFRFLSFDETLH